MDILTGQEDQVELSIKSLDDKDFIEFRKLLRVNDFFVILKKQNVLEYDLIGISSSDKNAAVLATCTDFYKLTTQTPVDIDFFGDVKKDEFPVSLEADSEVTNGTIVSIFDVIRESGYAVINLRTATEK